MKLFRLLAVNALLAALVFALIYAFILFLAHNDGRGGMDGTLFFVTAVSCLGPTLAFIAVQVVFARQLGAAARGERFLP